jgi:hypothetical protein
MLEPVYPEVVDNDHRRLSDIVRERMQRELDDIRGTARAD